MMNCGNKLVLQINPESVRKYPYDKSQFASWVLTATEEAIESLKSGSYNEYVSNNLPYKKRFGKILREDYWSLAFKLNPRALLIFHHNTSKIVMYRNNRNYITITR